MNGTTPSSIIKTFKISRTIAEILSPNERIVNFFAFNNYRVYFSSKRLIFEKGKDILTCTYSSIIYPKITERSKLIFWKSFNVTISPSRPYGEALRPIIAGKCSKQLDSQVVPANTVLTLEGSQQQIVQFVSALKEYLKYEPGVAPCISVRSGAPLIDAGRITPVEAVIINGKGDVIFTGLMKEVMQESAEAAITYIKSKADYLQIQKESISNKDVHIHMPEVVPKDGPSAGVSMVCALISALTNKSITKDIAMTGEITIKGHILPIGGVLEKVFAAYRSGIRKLILPIDNQTEALDVIKKHKQIKHELDNRAMIIYYVENLDEVVEIVFK